MESLVTKLKYWLSVLAISVVLIAGSLAVNPIAIADDDDDDDDDDDERRAPPSSLKGTLVVCDCDGPVVEVCITPLPSCDIGTENVCNGVCLAFSGGDPTGMANSCDLNSC